MDASGGFRFTGPMRPKAKLIPDDRWKEYEPEIRELYSSMTVEQLAEHMDRVHQFKATPRQYGSKFDQWGLKKYHMRGIIPASPIMQSTEATDLNFQTKDSRAAELAEWMHSVIKRTAKDSTPDLPSTKRRKVEYTSSPETTALWAHVESSKRDLKEKSLASTLLSSLTSSDSSYGDFKKASEAMERRAPFDDTAASRAPSVSEPHLPY